MLTRLQKATVTVALTICFAVAMGMEIWQASNSARVQLHHNPSTQNGHKTNYATIEQRHQATEETIAYYNKWLMFFTAILAFATVGLGTATAGLYFAGRRQLILARAEFAASHRPKIRIKHIWLVGLAPISRSP
jgi:hypothetical protein